MPDIGGMKMSFLHRIFAIVWILCLIISIVHSQTEKSSASLSSDSVFSDRSLGISFLRAGQASRHFENGYGISLRSEKGGIRNASAAISLSSRPTVDLPGSYGGKLYLDNLKAHTLLKSRIRVDSIDVGGVPFRREYWAVYSGMGAWEGSINCYALRNGRYYVISLTTDCILGKPGQEVGGKKMTSQGLQTRMVNILSDPQESVVQQFNTLLSSFRISEQ